MPHSLTIAERGEPLLEIYALSPAQLRRVYMDAQAFFADVKFRVEIAPEKDVPLSPFEQTST